MALGGALAAALALAFAVLGPLSHKVLAGDCKGQRQVLREAPGFVTDGAGNYSVNGNCEWLIEGEWGRVGHSFGCWFIHLCVHSLSTFPAPFQDFCCKMLNTQGCSQPGP